MRRFAGILLLLAFGATCTDQPEEPLDTESTGAALTTESMLVARAATWWMWNHGEDLGVAWREHDYTFVYPATSATAPLGYGETYVNPIDYGSDPNHKPITVYLRKDFYLADPAQVTALRFDCMYDDGFVFYVNGREGGRGSMPTGTITATTLSTGHEAEATYLSFDATGVKSALQAGWNTLAVEVHQAAPSSHISSPAMAVTCAGSVTVNCLRK
ncbi:MAG TPA: hypothetical protein VL172_06530 [Kofleriaceae bacterium]|nr:hypothetical protein [Kofleriaceae bacterium]